MRLALVASIKYTWRCLVAAMISQEQKGVTDIETSVQDTDGQRNVTESQLPDQEVG